MRPRNGRDEQMAALRERLSRLSEASLRINESLELDAVLQGVLDSARSLTDARYALITTMRDTGEVEDFVVSGLTAEEAQRLWEVPERMQLFSYFSSIPAPLRMPDFAAHMREMGLSDFRLPVPISSCRWSTSWATARRRRSSMVLPTPAARRGASRRGGSCSWVIPTSRSAPCCRTLWLALWS